MATLEELQNALISADKAGDTNSAAILASKIKEMQSAPAPFPLPRADYGLALGSDEALNGTNKTWYPPYVEAAAAKGVDVLTGSPIPEADTIIDYAPTQEGKLAAFRGFLMKKYGKPVQVRPADDGDMEYLNPATKLWTSRVGYGKPGATLPGVIEGTGQAVGSLIGGGLTALGTKSNTLTAVASVAGGAAGGAAAAALNTKIAGEYGYDVPLKEAMLRGATEGAYNTAKGEGALALLRVGRFIFRGPKYPLSIPEADAALKYADEGLQSLKGAKQLAGAETFNPPIANLIFASKNPAARALGEHVENQQRTAASTSEKAGITYNVQLKQNLDSLKATFDNITGRFKAPDDPSLSPKETVDLQKQAFLQNQIASQQIAEANAKAAVAGFPKLTDSEVAGVIKNAINGAYQRAQDVTNGLYTNLRIGLGIKPEFLDPTNKARYIGDVPSAMKISPDAQLLTEIYNYLKTAKDAGKLDPDRMAAMISVLPKGLLKREQVQELENSYEMYLNTDPTKGPVSGPGVVHFKQKVKNDFNVLQPDYAANVDSNNVLSFIQDTKEGVRNNFAFNQGLKIAPSAKDEQDVVNMLQSWLHRSWTAKGHPEFVELHEEAMQAAKDEANTFEKGLLSSLIKKKEGILDPISNQVINETMFKGDGEGMRALVNILKGAPEELEKVRQLPFAILTNSSSYFDQDLGVITSKAVAQWKKDFGPALRELLTDKEWNQITDLKSVASIFEQHAAETSRLAKWFEKSPLGKAGGMNAEDISNAVFAPKKALSQGQDYEVGLKYIMDTFDNAAPDLAAKIRQYTAQKLALKVTDAAGVPSAVALGKRLGDPFVTRRLTAVMGQDYVNDLNKLLGLAKINEAGAKTMGGITLTREQPFLQQIMRIETGYLGSKGIGYSVLLRLRGKAAGRAFVNMLSNPDLLRRAVQAQNVGLGTTVAAGILSDLQASYLNQGN